MRVPSLRRSDQQKTTEPEQTPERPAQRTEERPADRAADRPATRSRFRRRDRTRDFSTKIEKAAEQAAAATRTAAATAAAERAHARPRTSWLATFSLIVAVVAGLVVATGTLAGLGIVVGAVALLLAIAGLSATGTRRFRFVAGRSEATVALLISLGAIVIGALALADVLTWLDTGTDNVARVQDWLPSWLT